LATCVSIWARLINRALAPRMKSSPSLTLLPVTTSSPVMELSRLMSSPSISVAMARSPSL
jgi:hypothetical protein